MPRILIADDEANLRSTVARTLRSEGYETVEARDGVEAVSLLGRGGIDAVLLDLQMPRLDGFGVLRTLAEETGAPPVIVLTAHASLDNAVRAVRDGAWDFLEKPPAADALLLRVRRALESARQSAESEEIAADRPRLLGDSAPMRELRRQIARVAASPARVLILGENGTGKELVAREIHARSARSSGPLVRVNCSALPEPLFEAELFGHVKGAFTGALSSRRGRFERAAGGTLFLDEIGEIPLHVQPKLLRALEDGEIERVGAEQGTRVDVRVVAATNRDLPRMVADGSFREDLYYRLEVVTLRVPPLREMAEDVPSLAEQFLRDSCREIGRETLSLTGPAREFLARQSWPGNVRQLRNLMERLAILAPDGVLDEAVVEAHLAGSAPTSTAPDAGAARGTLSDAVAEFEREMIQQAIAESGGNISAAARRLGFERSSLYKKMKALGLRRDG